MVKWGIPAKVDGFPFVGLAKFLLSDSRWLMSVVGVVLMTGVVLNVQVRCEGCRSCDAKSVSCEVSCEVVSCRGV